MPRERIVAGLAAVLLNALLALLLFAPALVGGRLFFPLHTEQLLPWRTEVPPERLAGHAARDNPALTDKMWLFDPDTSLVADSLARGELPTWNRSIVGGASFLGQALYGSLYPPNLLLWRLLPVEQGHAWGAALHVVIAGLGLFVLLRQLGVATPPALLGGLLFAACGPLVVRYHSYMTFYPVAWIPWLLAAVHAFSGRPSLGRFVLVPLPIALVLLTGFPQTGLYGILLAGAYGVVRLLASRRTRGWRRIAALVALLAAFGGGAALAAIQILPFDEAAQRSLPRTHDVSTQIREAGSPWMLLGYVVPDAFADPREPWSASITTNPLWTAIYCRTERQADGRILPNAAAGPNPVETSCYAGAIGLLLALAALLTKPRPIVLVLVATLALCWAYALGWAPLVRLVALIPRMGVGEVRRIVPTTGLLVALLAGFGASAWIAVAGSGRRRCVLALGALLLLGVAGAAVAIDHLGAPAFNDLLHARLLERYGADLVALQDRHFPASAATQQAIHAFVVGRLGHAALLLAIGLVVLWFAHGLARDGHAGRAALVLGLGAAGDLLACHYAWNPFVPKEGFLAADPLLAPLAAERSGGRVHRFAPDYRIGDDTIEKLVLPPNLGERFGIEDVEGYIVAVPTRMAELLRLLEPETAPDSTVATVAVLPLHTPQALASPLLDLLAVRHVLTRHDLLAATAGAGLGDAGFSLAAQRGEVRIYENREALPFAFVAPEALFVAPAPDPVRPLASLRALATDTPALRRRVLLEGEPPAPPAGEFFPWTAASHPLAGGPDQESGVASLLTFSGELSGVRSIERSATRVVVHLTRGDGGVLFLADGYDPGWEAHVDGRAVPVFPADVAFRGLLLPPAATDVVFEYRPRAVAQGRKISLTTLAALAFLALTAAAAALFGILRSIRRTRRGMPAPPAEP